ncbi:RDD family protein [Streptomyces flavovirens]
MGADRHEHLAGRPEASKRYGTTVMSAPTPAPGDESPREGYYPDPSIPGYVRYWNGASWVPGTSRPAPRQDGASPAPPPVTAPVDETGPMYFDEADAAGETGEGSPDGTGADRPEPATAWQADTSRQAGFGGEHDRRVSWGGGPDPRAAGQTPSTAVPPSVPALPAAASEAPSGPVRRDVPPSGTGPAGLTPVDPRRPAVPGPARGALPGTRDEESGAGAVARRADRPGGADDAGARPPSEGTVTIRALGRGASRTPAPREQAPADGTMAMRALPATPTTPQASAPQPPTPAQSPPRTQNQAPNHAAPHHAAQSQAPNHAAQNQAARLPAPHQPQNRAQAPSRPVAPQLPGPADGSASWAQQVHQLARPEPAPGPQQPHPAPAQQHRQTAPPEQQQPVTPWKPPVDDPFQQLARAQAAARPAGLGKRLAARLLDTLVLGALVGAAGFPLATRALDHVDRKIDAAKQTGETVTVWLLDSTTAGLLGAVVAAFLVLGLLLEALPTAKWGRTLGKKLCGVEVRDIESHGTPTFKAALYRWLVYGVLGLLVVGVVNVLWCLIDRPWRQCWHDKAARTFVAG